jgi:hypothetical protein
MEAIKVVIVEIHHNNSNSRLISLILTKMGNQQELVRVFLKKLKEYLIDYIMINFNV